MLQEQSQEPRPEAEDVDHGLDGSPAGTRRGGRDDRRADEVRVRPPGATPTSTSSGTPAPRRATTSSWSSPTRGPNTSTSHGYKSGVYSSGSAGIAAIDAARAAKRKGFTLPDQLWIAWTNKVANTDGGPYLADTGWANHQRIHQYHNGINITYGGHKLNIDKDFLDVGTGSVASKQVLPCNVKMSFDSYPALKAGSRGPAGCRAGVPAA